jgi:hypothetical protein
VKTEPLEMLELGNGVVKELSRVGKRYVITRKTYYKNAIEEHPVIDYVLKFQNKHDALTAFQNPLTDDLVTNISMVNVIFKKIPLGQQCFVLILGKWLHAEKVSGKKIEIVNTNKLFEISADTLCMLIIREINDD